MLFKTIHLNHGVSDTEPSKLLKLALEPFMGPQSLEVFKKKHVNVFLIYLETFKTVSHKNAPRESRRRFIQPAIMTS